MRNLGGGEEEKNIKSGHYVLPATPKGSAHTPLEPILSGIDLMEFHIHGVLLH